jgi:hypothetical protein
MAITLPAFAQTPPPPAAQPPDPKALEVARQLVAKVSGDRDQTIASLARPMAAFMQQLGIKDPAQAKTLVDEAVMPSLRDHYDQLLASRTELYAKELSVADMQATLAFYNTPAGQDWIAAQPRLAQGSMATITQWLASIQPEMQARVKEVLQEHGWTHG